MNKPLTPRETEFTRLISRLSPEEQDGFIILMTKLATATPGEKEILYPLMTSGTPVRDIVSVIASMEVTTG